MRALLVGTFLLGTAALTTGCASSRMESQVRQARHHAALADQRSAALEARLRGIETSMILQQSMLGRTMAKQDATDRSVAALAEGTPRGAQSVAAPQVASAPPPPKELVGLAGETVVVNADDATVREILTKVEAYMGRRLTPSERLTLANVLRRPRVIDTTNPWGPTIFNER